MYMEFQYSGNYSRKSKVSRYDINFKKFLLFIKNRKLIDICEFFVFFIKNILLLIIQYMFIVKLC